jgi:hypothetical protein
MRAGLMAAQFGVLLFLSTAASASDWRAVSSDASRTMWIDAASVRYGQGSALLAWFKLSYPAGQMDGRGKRFRSEIQLWAFDCAQHRMAPLQATEFTDAGASGEVVGSHAWPPYGWSYTAPDTLGELQLKTACGLAPKHAPKPQ